MSGVVTGFEPLEILRSILRLLTLININSSEICNEYTSVVTNEGNLSAQKILNQVYEPVDSIWRGIGVIKKSSLKIRDEFAEFDIENVLPIKVTTKSKTNACRCGDVLRGVISPVNCPLFGKMCKPNHAVGPCMVSVEGVCAAWYKYGGNRFNI